MSNMSNFRNTCSQIAYILSSNIIIYINENERLAMQLAYFLVMFIILSILQPLIMFTVFIMILIMVRPFWPQIRSRFAILLREEQTRRLFAELAGSDVFDDPRDWNDYWMEAIRGTGEVDIYTDNFINKLCRLSLSVRHHYEIRAWQTVHRLTRPQVYQIYHTAIDAAADGMEVADIRRLLEVELSSMEAISSWGNGRADDDWFGRVGNLNEEPSYFELTDAGDPPPAYVDEGPPSYEESEYLGYGTPVEDECSSCGTTFFSAEEQPVWVVEPVLKEIRLRHPEEEEQPTEVVEPILKEVVLRSSEESEFYSEVEEPVLTQVILQMEMEEPQLTEVILQSWDMPEETSFRKNEETTRKMPIVNLQAWNGMPDGTREFIDSIMDPFCVASRYAGRSINDLTNHLVNSLRDVAKGTIGLGAELCWRILQYGVEMFKNLWNPVGLLVNGVLNSSGDVLYCGAVIIILAASHVGGIPHIVTALLNVLMGFFFGDNVLRSTVASIAVAYSAMAYKKELDVMMAKKTVVTTTVNIGDRRPEVQLQADFDPYAILFSSVAKLMVCILSMVLVVKLPDTKSFDGLLRRFDLLPKAIKGLTNIAEIVDLGMKYAFGQHYRYFFGDETITATEIPENIKLHSDEVLSLCTSESYTQMAGDIALCARVSELYQQYQQFRVQHARNRTIQNYLDKYGGAINNLFVKASSHAPKNNENRPKPTVLMLQGGTGVGKSQLLYFICASLLKKDGRFKENATSEEVNDMVAACMYSRAAEQDFWDAYHGQHVCLWDDFGQMVDSASNPNTEFFELIRAANTFPYPLHMADISQKANTYFKSEYLVATTNLRRLDPTSVVDPDAVRSRIHFSYNVSIKPEFQVNPQGNTEMDHRIDARKVLAAGKRFNMDIYEFRKIDMATGQIFNDVIDYNQLVEALHAHHAEQHALFSDARAALFEHVQLQMWPFGGDDDRQYRMNAVRDIRQSLWLIQDKIRQTVIGMQMYMPVFAIIGVVGAVVGLVYLAWKIWTDKEETENDEDINVEEWLEKNKAVEESGKSKANTQRVRVEEIVPESGKSKENARHVRVEEVVPESGKSREQVRQIRVESDISSEMSLVRNESYASQQSADIVTKIVNKSMFVFRHPDTAQVICPLVCFGGRIYGINHHYWVRVQEKFDSVLLTSSFSKRGTCIRVTEMGYRRFARQIGDVTDLTLLTMPLVVPLGYSLWRNFHSISEYGYVKGVRNVLVSVSKRDDETPVCFFKTGKIIDTLTEPIITDERNILKSKLYVTDTATTFGDCGGIYVADCNELKGKILGFHFAGYEKTSGGIMIPLYYEDFEGKMGPIEMIPIPDVEINDVKPPLEGIVYHGSTKKAVRSALKTQFIKTPIFNLVDKTTMKPARLEPILKEKGVGLRGLEKVTGNVCILDRDVLLRAKQSFKTKVLTGDFQADERRVLTFDEAVAGIPCSQFIRGINRTRSAGWPWSLTTKQKGKTKWFGTHEWVLNSPEAQEVRQRVEEMEQQMAEGKWQPAIFVDTEKDETRTIEKVDQGKTRIFSAAPMDFVILFRKYFLGFLSYAMRKRVYNEIAVGICAQSNDWDKMARYLKQKGDNIIAGDFSNYDGTLHPDILLAALDIINEFYDDDFKLQRQILFENVIHSYHIAEDRIYGWTHSQPSGNPGTAVLNSMYNSLVCRMVYYALEEAQGIRNTLHDSFNAKVNMVSYGDDNLLSVDSSVPWFNMAAMCDEMKKLGMTYTAETKDGSIYKYKPLVECAFLQRSFRLDDNGMWYGPLGRRSINERLNWMQKTQDAEGVLRQNIDGAIAEWALHDKATFEMWSKKISVVALNYCNYAPPIFPQEWYLQAISFGDFTSQFPMLDFA
nr:MAG: non-structural polyprotein [Dicistroviridae TZ-1]